MSVRGNWGHDHTVTEQVFRMDAWLNFFGRYIAEGSVRRRTGEPTEVYVSQKITSHKLPYLQRAVQELGFGFTRSDVADKRRPPLVMSTLVIANNQSATYLSQFGTSGEKFIPTELKNVSKRQLRILFDSLMLGDGHVAKKTGSMFYHSKSLRLLSDVQEIAIKLGYGATICTRKRNDRGFPERYLLHIKAPQCNDCIKDSEMGGLRWCGLLLHSSNRCHHGAAKWKSCVQWQYHGRVRML